MMKRIGLAGVVLLALTGILMASAPQIVWQSNTTALPFVPCFDTGNSAVPFKCQAVNSANPLPTSASVSGNIGGYDLSAATGDGTVPAITVQAQSYSGGQSEGGLITAPIIRTAGNSGIIDFIALYSKGASTNSGWIYGWTKSPASSCGDKTNFTLSAADKPFAIPGFPINFTLSTLSGSPSWDTGSQVAFTNLVNNFKNKDSPASANLYFCIVTSGSVTPASTSDLMLQWGLVQD